MIFLTGPGGPAIMDLFLSGRAPELNISLKRSAAGGESCKAGFFFTGNSVSNGWKILLRALVRDAGCGEQKGEDGRYV